MSDMETVRGRLQLVEGDSLEATCEAECRVNGITEAWYSGSFIDQLHEDLYDKYIVVNKKLYKFLEREELDSAGFSEVSEREDGTIDFLCHWYNGGAGLSEVIESDLKKETTCQ